MIKNIWESYAKNSRQEFCTRNIQNNKICGALWKRTSYEYSKSGMLKKSSVDYFLITEYPDDKTILLLIKNIEKGNIFEDKLKISVQNCEPNLCSLIEDMSDSEITIFERRYEFSN